jgi:3-oxoacyl-[acyl-carrier protein] reductase
MYACPLFIRCGSGLSGGYRPPSNVGVLNTERQVSYHRTFMDSEECAMSLHDKVVLVTGAGSGLGRAIASEFNSRGSIVIALDVDAAGTEQTVSEFTNDAPRLACCADVSRTEAVTEAVGQVLNRFGRVDVLVNNAGIFDHRTRAVDTTDDLWDRVIGVNLTGQFLMARAVLPGMVSRGAGVIINMASVCSTVAGGGGTAYTVSKHGVLGLTRELAHEYGPAGIRVNAVAPGAIMTPMAEASIEPGTPDDVRSTATAAGRYGKPREVADVVAFLADEGSSFMHGSLVTVDGGYTTV